MENSRVCVESLNGMEEVNEEIIEDVKAHTDSVDLKWQRWLAFEYNMDKKTQEMDKTKEGVISADETGPDWSPFERAARIRNKKFHRTLFRRSLQD